MHGPGNFPKFILHLRKILLLWREYVFSGRGVGALKPSTFIFGALKSYDFSVHGPGDFSKCILHLRKILSVRREDAFFSRWVGALKPCDAYSRSTKIVRFFCAWAGRFFKIYPSFSENSFTLTGGCVLRPRSWSTKIMRRVFSEH